MAQHETVTRDATGDGAAEQDQDQVPDGRQDRVVATSPANGSGADRERTHDLGQTGEAQEGDKERRSTRDSDKDRAARRATYLALMSIFGGLFVAFTARERGKKRAAPPPIRPFDVVLLALSVFRLSRIVASDEITEPLRAPVTKETEDGSEPKGRGLQRALGELVSCPTCIGVWISAAFSYGLLWLPGPTRVALSIIGAAGAAEALNFVMSALDATTKAQTKRAEETGG